MDQNPYTPPHAVSESPAKAMPRQRFTFGNLVFVGLGGLLAYLPAWSIVWAINKSRTISFAVATGAAVMFAFGILLIFHGLLRSNATIITVVGALVAIALLIGAAIVFG